MMKRRQPEPPDLSNLSNLSRFFRKTARNRFDRVRVAPTERRGLGVFATGAIKSGRAVGRIVGKIQSAEFRSEYCVGFGAQVLEPEAPYRFLNHSCEPNCEIIEWNLAFDDENDDTTEIKDKNKSGSDKIESNDSAFSLQNNEDASTSKPKTPVVLELWLHALRDVAVDEELTIDYGWDWKAAIPCFCESPNCRGWICKEEDLEICRRERGAAQNSRKD